MKLFDRFEKWILLAIIVLAMCLRLPYLSDIPSGFHADEAAYGYNAYSVLKTGRDEYGRLLPLIFESFGDSKAAVYSYLTIPWIAIFGLNEFAVRFPSVIFGVVFVLLTYLLVFRFSGDKRLSALTTLLAAVSPLGIELSRVQSDPLVCIVFFYLAVYLWLIWLEKRKGIYIVCMLATLFLSFLTYTVTRLFAIPFFVLFACMFWKSYNAQAKRMFALVSCIALSAIIFLSVGFAGGRFSQINVFSSQDVQLILDEEIREDGVAGKSSIEARIIHNKPIAYARYMLTNFSSYLSSDFLFFQTEQPRREQIPHMGVLLLIECPFLLVGIYQAFKKKLRYGVLSVLWFLLVPATLSIISGETPNIHRFFLAMFPIHILVGLGILAVINALTHIHRNIVVIGIAGVFLLNIGYFFHQLFVHQPTHFPYYRGFAYKELVQKLPLYYDDYNHVVVTKGNESPYIYILFFGSYDPTLYQRSGSHRDLDYQGFGKYVFVPYDCPSFNGTTEMNIVVDKEHTLLVRRGNCVLGGNDKLLDRVFWRDGSEAFQLVKYQDAPIEK